MNICRITLFITLLLGFVSGAHAQAASLLFNSRVDRTEYQGTIEMTYMVIAKDGTPLSDRVEDATSLYYLPRGIGARLLVTVNVDWTNNLEAVFDRNGNPRYKPRLSMGGSQDFDMEWVKTEGYQYEFDIDRDIPVGTRNWSVKVLFPNARIHQRITVLVVFSGTIASTSRSNMIASLRICAAAYNGPQPKGPEEYFLYVLWQAAKAGFTISGDLTKYAGGMTMLVDAPWDAWRQSRMVTMLANVGTQSQTQTDPGQTTVSGLRLTPEQAAQIMNGGPLPGSTGSSTTGGTNPPVKEWLTVTTYEKGSQLLWLLDVPVECDLTIDYDGSGPMKPTTVHVLPTDQVEKMTATYRGKYDATLIYTVKQGAETRTYAADGRRIS